MLLYAAQTVCLPWESRNRQERVVSWNGSFNSVDWDALPQMYELVNHLLVLMSAFDMRQRIFYSIVERFKESLHAIDMQ